MPYFASQIANYFICRSLSDGVPVDPLKLQKLVYVAHGWHLAFEKTPLIGEKVEAWKYGPVVPSLYRQLRDCGYSNVLKTLEEPAGAPQLSERTKALLTEVWRKYGHLSGVVLSAMTHESGYAWELARRGNDSSWNSPNIDNAWIQDEFERRKTKV